MNGTNQLFLYTLIAGITSCLFGLFTIPKVLDYCKEKGLYDIPNARKVHKNAIPRLGGVVFLSSVFVGCIVSFIIYQLNGTSEISISLWTLFFFIGAAAIYATGLIDDIIGLGPLTKLTVQLIAACALPLSGLYINNLHGFCGIYDIPYYIGMPLTVVIVAFISNAINLIDGIDGLAGGLTMIAMAGFFYAFSIWGLTAYSTVIAAIIGVLLPYLYFNIQGDASKNRKIFMGDTGSLTIGFLLAFLCLKISMENPHLPHYPGNGLLIAFTLIAVPVFDVFRVAFLRIRNRRSPITPDKNHIHHKLLRAGCSQHQALCVILLLALLFCLINYILHSYIGITFTVVADILVYTLFHLLLNKKISSKGEKPSLFE